MHVFVCLVCNIHFPGAVWSLIRPACLSSELWQELTCGALLLLPQNDRPPRPGSTLTPHHVLMQQLCVCESAHICK